MKKKVKYDDLRNLVLKLRSLFPGNQGVLIFAYNRTGKTRLSMEFKNEGRNNGGVDTLYYNAFTEDLFVWDNDFHSDKDRHLKINDESRFFSGLKELALDSSISDYLTRYTDFDFDIDYEEWKVTFHKGTDRQIKISRGEENIFIWCLFMAICERVIDGHESYNWVKYLYIDDPISSLDDNNAIAMACDLSTLVRKAAGRQDERGLENPLYTIVSTHHALFFNVMCNELGRKREGQDKIKTKRFFLNRPNSQGEYTLQSTNDSPFFQHIGTLSELQECLQNGTLYTYHFNALRSILEKTASFFGHDDLKHCLKGLDDETLYNRAVNLLSHGKYSIYEPVEMGEDNKILFGKILDDILKRYQFSLPEYDPNTNEMEKINE